MSGGVPPISGAAATPGRAALWATLSILVFGASLYLALPITTVLPDDLQMATLPLVWGAVAIGGVLLFARSAFGRWPRIGQEALVQALVGLLLAGAMNAVLHAWTVERFGSFSGRLIGPTAGLFAVVVASAVAGLAALVAPAGARLAPVLVAVVMAVGAVGIGALNVPGALDGITAESIPLAMLVAAAVAYTLVVAWVVLRRVRASGS
jgi:hypothetical protein